MHASTLVFKDKQRHIIENRNNPDSVSFLFNSLKDKVIAEFWKAICTQKPSHLLGFGIRSLHCGCDSFQQQKRMDSKYTPYTIVRNAPIALKKNISVTADFTAELLGQEQLKYHVWWAPVLRVHHQFSRYTFSINHSVQTGSLHPKLSWRHFRKQRKCCDKTPKRNNDS